MARELAREAASKSPSHTLSRIVQATFAAGGILMLFALAQLFNVIRIPPNPFGPDGPSALSILVSTFMAMFVLWGAGIYLVVRQFQTNKFMIEAVRRVTKTFQRRTGIKGSGGAIVRSAYLATLALESEPHAGKLIHIEEHTVFIGRVPEKADVLFEWDDYLSGRHAKICYEQGRFFIWDMQSANGTWVNDQRVPRSLSDGTDFSEAVELIDGSVIRLGPDLRLRFKAGTELDQMWTQAATRLSPFAPSLPAEVRELIEEFIESITLTATAESLVGDFFAWR